MLLDQDVSLKESALYLRVIDKLVFLLVKIQLFLNGGFSAPLLYFVVVVVLIFC